MKYFKITCIEAEIVIVAKDEEEAAWTGLQLANEADMNIIDIEPIRITKKMEFPNKIKAIMEIDAEEMLEDLDFEEFYTWRVCSHELLDGYHSIIRVHNTNGKITECVYKNRGAAVNKVKKLMSQGLSFDIATEAGVVAYPK